MKKNGFLPTRTRFCSKNGRIHEARKWVNKMPLKSRRYGRGPQPETVSKPFICSVVIVNKSNVAPDCGRIAFSLELGGIPVRIKNIFLKT